MKMIAVVDPETALGFRLGGVEAVPVRSAAEAAPRLLAFLAAKDVGLVLYADDWLEDLPEDVRRRLERSDIPIFTPVPTLRTWREKDRVQAYMAGLLKRTIGYQIRLK
ncbi:MAG: V-type ATP synthase subunit F [Nitrospirae bacterium]|nr:V-type ATP synthase subunit F [Nitrospirota bacterium]